MTRAVLALALVATCLGCSREERIVTIPIDGRPSAVTVSGGFVWVADDQNDRVLMIDTSSREVLESFEVEDAPVALDVDGLYLWIAHSNGTITKIWTRPDHHRRVIRTGGDLTGISKGFATDVDKGVYDIAAKQWTSVKDGAVRPLTLPNGVWMSGREDTVTRFFSLEQTVSKVGNGPIGLAYDGTDVWVANSDDDTIQTVDGARVVSVGDAPVALAFLDGAVWSANQDAGTISGVGGNNEVTTIDVGTRPRGIAAGEGAVWVVGVNENALVRVVP